MGDYERIFPLMPDELESSEKAKEKMELYNMFIHFSKEVWGESAAGGFSKKKTNGEYERSILANSPAREK